MSQTKTRAEMNQLSPMCDTSDPGMDMSIKEELPDYEEYSGSSYNDDSASAEINGSCSMYMENGDEIREIKPLDFYYNHADPSVRQAARLSDMEEWHQEIQDEPAETAENYARGGLRDRQLPLTITDRHTSQMDSLSHPCSQHDDGVQRPDCDSDSSEFDSVTGQCAVDHSVFKNECKTYVCDDPVSEIDDNIKGNDKDNVQAEEQFEESDVRPDMNLLTLSTLVHDKETAIRFLQSHGVIHQQRLCNNGHKMTLSIVSDRWRCNARQCRQEIGLRKGTWLQRSRMEFRTVILFIYCWSKNLATIKFCSEELSIGHTTAVEWKNFLHEICAWRLLQTPTIVGGPGLHVEIDETLISRRKNHAGRVLPQQWIFGGICRETKEVFMYAVPDRTAATLLDAIQACIAPGSIIISDMWASYQGIESMIGMNYTHQAVNHTENFVDPTTGAHTQTIKFLWHVYKMQNKRQCGTHRSLVDSYLCEFIWRQRYRHTDLFMQIINDISQFHPLQ